jgi:hypothetical protein
VNVLQRGRLAPEPGTIVDDLEDELSRKGVHGGHENASVSPLARRPSFLQLARLRTYAYTP